MSKLRPSWLLIIVVIVIAGSALVLVLVNGGNQQIASFALRGLLSSQDCERACWLGIEPGVTDRETVESILVSAGIEYVAVPLPEPEKNAVYDFYENESSEAKGFVTISGETVSQIALVFDACTTHVLDEYGLPAEVQEDGYGMTLLYPEPGLVFSLTTNDPMRLAGVFLTAKSVFEANFAGESLEYNWDEFSHKFTGQCDDNLVPIS